MKHKAFTLIELLVVVAIIGILAAIGVNTFSGFQEKAKIASVKSMHGQVVKFISTELMKCSLGSELKLKIEPNRYSNDLCSDFSNATLSPGNAANFTYNFMKHFQNGERWRNVYDDSIMTDSCFKPDKKGKLCFSSEKNSVGNYVIAVRSQTKDGSSNLLENFLPLLN